MDVKKKGEINDISIHKDFSDILFELTNQILQIKNKLV